MRALQAVNHRGGLETGGEVDIADIDAQERVAHAPADEACLAFGRAERAEQRHHPLSLLPVRSWKLHAITASRRLRFTILAAVAPHIRRPSPSKIGRESCRARVCQYV